jgi:sugar phosphate isomerase/epimerase
MRFGACRPLESLDAVEELGFDYIEMGVQPTLVPESPDAEFGAIARVLRRHRLRPEAMNGFLPVDLKVVGLHVDPARVRRYVWNVGWRAREVGCEVVVFGSTPSRDVPPGFPIARARQQVVHFMRLISDLWAEGGPICVLEPANPKETNYIHTVHDGLGIVRAVNRPNVLAFGDFYHMVEGGEGTEGLLEAGPLLHHMHAADSGRRPPSKGHADFGGLFRALRRTGYRGRFSLECIWDRFSQEGGEALAHLRRTWARVADGADLE